MVVEAELLETEQGKVSFALLRILGLGQGLKSFPDLQHQDSFPIVLLSR